MAHSGPTILSSSIQNSSDEDGVIMQLTKFKLSEMTSFSSCCKRESLFVNLSIINFHDAPEGFDYNSWNVPEDLLKSVLNRYSLVEDYIKKLLLADLVRLPDHDEYEYMSVIIYSKYLININKKDKTKIFEVIDADEAASMFGYSKKDMNFFMGLMCYDYDFIGDESPYKLHDHDKIYTCMKSILSDLILLQTYGSDVLESSVGFNLLYILLYPKRFFNMDNTKCDCARQLDLLAILWEEIPVFTTKWRNMIEKDSNRFLEVAFFASGSVFKMMFDGITLKILDDNANVRGIVTDLLKMQNRKTGFSIIDYAILGRKKETFLYLLELMEHLDLLAYVQHFCYLLSEEDKCFIDSILGVENLGDNIKKIVYDLIRNSSTSVNHNSSDDEYCPIGSIVWDDCSGENILFERSSNKRKAVYDQFSDSTGDNMLLLNVSRKEPINLAGARKIHSGLKKHSGLKQHISINKISKAFSKLKIPHKGSYSVSYRNFDKSPDESIGSVRKLKTD